MFKINNHYYRTSNKHCPKEKNCASNVTKKKCCTELIIPNEVKHCDNAETWAFILANQPEIRQHVCDPVCAHILNTHSHSRLPPSKSTGGFWLNESHTMVYAQQLLQS